MDFGRRRWLSSRNNFRDGRNAFDEVYWQLGRDKSRRVRPFLVQPVLRNDVQPDERSKRSVFRGTFIETDQVPGLRFNTYYFGLNDQRSATVDRQRTFSTFGTRLYDKPKTGRMDYEIESAWQTGKKGDINHFAHFQYIEIGYTLALPWSPRFLIHDDDASGDRDARDNQDSAFERFGARDVSSMPPRAVSGRFFGRTSVHPGQVVVAPCQGCNVQLRHRVWHLAPSRGPFAGNGSRDAMGGADTFLGQDVEPRARWKTNDNLAFDLGYVHWLKGRYFAKLSDSAPPPGGNRDSRYFYILTKFSV